MEESILKSVKKILMIPEDDPSFDLDVTTHINATFSILSQLGVGPVEGFFIEDDTDLWTDFDVPEPQRNLAKTYIQLKVKLLFDPPGTSFALDAMKNQIEEYEWRLNSLREPDRVLPEEVTT
jgi:hypothetical protein